MDARLSDNSYLMTSVSCHQLGISRKHRINIVHWFIDMEIDIPCYFEAKVAGKVAKIITNSKLNDITPIRGHTLRLTIQCVKTF